MNTNCSCSSRQRSGALHLTQKVDYGLILLTFLARQKQNRLSVKKIAEESKVSFLFLQKIAGLLQKAGLIKAERGKFGGYSLAKASDQLNMADVIEALEGPVALVPCLTSKGCKHMSYCSIRPNMAKLNFEIQNAISTKTLDYFLS